MSIKSFQPGDSQLYKPVEQNIAHAAEHGAAAKMHSEVYSHSTDASSTKGMFRGGEESKQARSLLEQTKFSLRDSAARVPTKETKIEAKARDFSPPRDSKAPAAADVQTLERNLADPSRSSAAKLADVERLHNKGISQFTSDGTTYKTREEKVGDRTMVHLFSQGKDGKEQVALRGIDDGKKPVEQRSESEIQAGKDMTQERSPDGKHVSFLGGGSMPGTAGRVANGAGRPDPRDTYGSAHEPSKAAPLPPTRELSAHPGADKRSHLDPRHPGAGSGHKDAKHLPDLKGDAPEAFRDALATKAEMFARINASNNNLRDPRTGLGNCSAIPREALDQFGVHLQPMSGFQQGQKLEHMKDQFGRNLFRPVSEPERGDHASRNWAYRTYNGVKLGDSVIITGDAAHNRGVPVGVSGAVAGAFPITTQGGYYTPAMYLRPTAAFYDDYMHGRKEY